MIGEAYTLEELEIAMAENPTLKIERKYVLGLGKWLSMLSLMGRESRERTKFVEILADEVKENEAMRMELLNKYAEKDEKGDPVQVDGENGSKHFRIPDEKMPEFVDEMNKYLAEEFVVSGEGNVQKLKVVKNIILDTQEKIDATVATEYDKWCEAFERVES